MVIADWPEISRTDLTKKKKIIHTKKFITLSALPSLACFADPPLYLNINIDNSVSPMLTVWLKWNIFVLCCFLFPGVRSHEGEQWGSVDAHSKHRVCFYHTGWLVPMLEWYQTGGCSNGLYLDTLFKGSDYAKHFMRLPGIYTYPLYVR